MTVVEHSMTVVVVSGNTFAAFGGGSAVGFDESRLCCRCGEWGGRRCICSSLGAVLPSEGAFPYRCHGGLRAASRRVALGGVRCYLIDFGPLGGVWCTYIKFGVRRLTARWIGCSKGGES